MWKTRRASPASAPAAGPDPPALTVTVISDIFTDLPSNVRSLCVYFKHTLCVRGSSSTGICDVRKKVGFVWDKSNLRSYLCSQREPSSHINRMHTCVYNKIYTMLLLALLCITWGDDFILQYSSIKKAQTLTFKVYMS